MISPLGGDAQAEGGAYDPPAHHRHRPHRASRSGTSTRAMVPEETPVALSFAGTTHAVMMASPADFEDFALGFSLTEGIIAVAGRDRGDRGRGLDGAGIDIQIRLKDKRQHALRGAAAAGWPGRSAAASAASNRSRRRCASVASVGQSTLTLDADDIVAVGAAAVEGAAAACRDRRGACRRLLRARQGHRRGARGCRPPQCAGQAGRRAGARPASTARPAPSS